MAKKAYRVCNWAQYNKSLVQRGSLIFWFSEEVIQSWKCQGSSESHGNQKYSDMLILCALTLRQLYRLPLRATAGLMSSLAALMGLKVSAPDYSTLCKRGKRLKINLNSSSIGCMHTAQQI